MGECMREKICRGVSVCVSVCPAIGFMTYHKYNHKHIVLAYAKASTVAAYPVGVAITYQISNGDFLPQRFGFVDALSKPRTGVMYGGGSDGGDGGGDGDGGW